MITFSLIAYTSGKGVPTLRLWRNILLWFPAFLLAATLFGQTASQNQSSPKVAANEAVEVHLGKGY